MRNDETNGMAVTLVWLMGMATGVAVSLMLVVVLA